MSKKVLLIGENVSSFITNAIRDSLKANGYEVDCANPDIEEIKYAGETPDVYLLYAGEFVEKNPEIIIYLKDRCMECEKMLYAIGYNEELELIKKTGPENILTATFERPLNVKLLVEMLNVDMWEADRKAVSANTKKHILVVDDSGIMLRTVKSWLSNKYKVSIVSSGAMAISFLASNHPDLILLDYEMPICSGPQVMEMIHAEPCTSDIPIMFLTAKDDVESVTKVLELKPVGYLLKTMAPEQIVEKIDQFFKKQKK